MCQFKLSKFLLKLQQNHERTIPVIEKIPEAKEIWKFMHVLVNQRKKPYEKPKRTENYFLQISK